MIYLKKHNEDVYKINAIKKMYILFKSSFSERIYT